MFKFHQNRLSGSRYVGPGLKSALSHYFGRWLIQLLVLPYKSWCGTSGVYFNLPVCRQSFGFGL